MLPTGRAVYNYHYCHYLQLLCGGLAWKLTYVPIVQHILVVPWGGGGDCCVIRDRSSLR